MGTPTAIFKKRSKIRMHHHQNDDEVFSEKSNFRGSSLLQIHRGGDADMRPTVNRLAHTRVGVPGHTVLSVVCYHCEEKLLLQDRKIHETAEEPASKQPGKFLSVPPVPVRMR